MALPASPFSSQRARSAPARSSLRRGNNGVGLSSADEPPRRSRRNRSESRDGGPKTSTYGLRYDPAKCPDDVVSLREGDEERNPGTKARILQDCMCPTELRPEMGVNLRASGHPAEEELPDIFPGNAEERIPPGPVAGGAGLEVLDVPGGRFPPELDHPFAVPDLGQGRRPRRSPTARSPKKSWVQGRTRPSQKMMSDAQRNVQGAYFRPLPRPPISPAQLCMSLTRTRSGGNSLNVRGRPASPSGRRSGRGRGNR